MKLKRILIILLCGLTFAVQARAEKIRTLAQVVGAETLHIEGTGVVTGLNGTGDKKQAALKLLKAYMEKNDVALDLADLDSSNIAFVKVDVDIPAFTQPGEMLDVRVSALNASSLEGGILQQCFLRARPGGDVFATAWGRVQIGGGTLHPTTGMIPANTRGGAQIMKPLMYDVVEDDYKFRLNVLSKSHEDAGAIARRINESESLNPYKQQAFGFGGGAATKNIAWALDAGQVIVQIPPTKRREQTEFIAAVLRLEVPVERPARVLFNRQTRSVIITGDVRVDPVAFSHGNRFVTLEAPDTGAPEELRGPERQYRLQDDEQRRLVELQGHQRAVPSLQEMVHTLNAMGTTTEDLVTILQKLKSSGALHAELIVE